MYWKVRHLLLMHGCRHVASPSVQCPDFACVAGETKLIREQAVAEGKPAKVIDRIVQGRVEKVSHRSLTTFSALCNLDLRFLLRVVWESLSLREEWRCGLRVSVVGFDEPHGSLALGSSDWQGFSIIQFNIRFLQLLGIFCTLIGSFLRK